MGGIDPQYRERGRARLAFPSSVIRASVIDDSRCIPVTERTSAFVEFPRGSREKICASRLLFVTFAFVRGDNTRRVLFNDDDERTSREKGESGLSRDSRARIR